MNAEELIALNEEIAGMARAGLPLDQALAALARDMGRGRLKEVTTALAQDLKAGHPLPEALNRQAGRVPGFYGALVAAGIRTGRIAEVLATLTTYARTIATLRALVIDALFYPGLVLVVGMVLFALLCVGILPQFDQIYTDFHLTLPWLTQVALRFGRNPVVMLLAPLGVVVLCCALGYLGMRWTERGRYRWAELLYSVPLVGTLIHSARMAGFTELLAILVDHSLPLPEAFQLAGEASSDPIMAWQARDICRQLTEGRSLGETLRGRGFVPEWVAWMTGLGEQRGTLGKTLHQVAELYRRRVEMRAALLRSVLPPIFIIAIAGVLVGFFVVAGMLPMVKLLEALSR
jgi:type II secretory pathway component PulF